MTYCYLRKRTSENLKKYMITNHLTIIEFSNLLEVHTSTVLRWFKNPKRIKILEKNKLKIIKLFELPKSKMKKKKKKKVILLTPKNKQKSYNQIIKCKWQHLNFNCRCRLKQRHDNWQEYITYLTLDEVHFLTDQPCYICGVMCFVSNKKPINSNDFTFDHVIPFINGGKHIFSNIRACCFKCNKQKGIAEYIQFINGKDAYRTLLKMAKRFIQASKNPDLKTELVSTFSLNDGFDPTNFNNNYEVN